VHESIEIIDALLQANPKNSGLHKRKAIALIKDNEFQNALKSLETSIKLLSDQ
jgi:Flp pilus assembly protein TadD